MKHFYNKELRKARPNLRLVSPLAHWTVVVMAVFNLFLGASLLLFFDKAKFSAPLPIVNDILTFKFWGILFIALGLVKLYSILTNHWKMARVSLFVGVSIKAAWAVALVLRMIAAPATFFITLLWVTVALLQMGAYVYFLPPQLVGTDRKKMDE